MRERPIIFSAPMVRAIQAGTKTQTRRVVKLNLAGRPQRAGKQWHVDDPDAVAACPYGQPGDRLYVRETWADANSDGGPCVLYRADDDRHYIGDDGYPVDYAKYPGADFAQWAADVESGVEGRWRPSIHMPRWASRITLEVTGVRVERLQAISEPDARAEGAHFHDGRGIGHSGWRHDDGAVHDDARSAFARIWASLNSAGSWDANPWVWVIEFRRANDKEKGDGGS